MLNTLRKYKQRKQDQQLAKQFFNAQVAVGHFWDLIEQDQQYDLTQEIGAEDGAHTFGYFPSLQHFYNVNKPAWQFLKDYVIDYVANLLQVNKHITATQILNEPVVLCWVNNDPEPIVVLKQLKLTFLHNNKVKLGPR